MISKKMMEGHSRIMQHQQQPYDSSLKALFQEEAAGVIPLFLPGARFVEVCDVEVIRPTMRVDRVYKVQYRGKPHIFHLEFETGSDSDMAYRMLLYHVGIYAEHRIPVISIIVYPFRTSIAESPLREISENEELLTFHFRKSTLWTESAERYVKAHELSIYPLLPAMQGANETLLLQAIEELKEYYKDNESKLARRLLWLGIFLRRAETVPPRDKRKVEERLDMFEHLLEQDEYIQKQRALGEAEGELRGETRGEIRGMQKGIISIVDARFPTLTKLAQQHIERIDKPDDLDRLLRMIVVAPDENTARFVISTYAA